MLLNNCVFLPLRNISNKISCIVAGSLWDSTGNLQCLIIYGLLWLSISLICVNWRILLSCPWNKEQFCQYASCKLGSPRAQASLLLLFFYLLILILVLSMHIFIRKCRYKNLSLEKKKRKKNILHSVYFFFFGKMLLFY